MKTPKNLPPSLTETIPEPRKWYQNQDRILSITASIAMLFLFLISLEMMIDCFKMLGDGVIEKLIVATSNPFVAFFIGLLATALIQSSGTTTSLIVVIVASGSLTMRNAVPMVMGANIGTTITCLLVSFAHLSKEKVFKRAFEMASLHHFFNVCTALILFPLEYYSGFLTELSQYVGHFLYSPGFFDSDFNLLKYSVYPLASVLSDPFESYPMLGLILSIGLLFGSIQGIIFLLKRFVLGSSQNGDTLGKKLFASPSQSFTVGLFGTALVHSSALMTSLAVPLAATKQIKIKKAFPYLVGANIGTTFTALTAAIAVSSPAVSIALAHVFFNVLGAILFLGIPLVRQLPLYFAKKLSTWVAPKKYAAILYIAFIFFAAPFILIYFSQQKIHIQEYKFHCTDILTGKKTEYLLVQEKNTQTGIEKLYKYANQKQSQEIRQESDQKQVMMVEKKQDFLFIGDEFFYLGKAGVCWPVQTALGIEKHCLMVKDSSLALQAGTLPRKVWVYQNRNTSTNVREKIYVDLALKIVVKRERFDSSKHLQYVESMYIKQENGHAGIK